MVAEALNKMDEVDRDALTLGHFEQLNNIEAATKLGMEESATSKRYIRALKKLKASLAGISDGLGGVEE